MLGKLRALFGVILDLALLRRGPDSLPTSNALLAGTIAFYVAVSALMTSMLPGATRTWPLQLAITTILTLLWFNFAFRVTQKSERFVQTMTGLFAVNGLFAPLLIPMLGALAPYLQKQDPQAPMPFALFLLTTILGVWLFIVNVRIVRAAFEWPYFASIAFLCGLNFVAYVVFLLLFGVPAKPV